MRCVPKKPTRILVDGKICVAYGSSPPDPAEAYFNKKVGEDVASALVELGWEVSILPLTSSDNRTIEEKCVFNLCDGDEETRTGMVAFARELADSEKSYTGSHYLILEKCKEKTLSWLSSVSVPQHWNVPPPSRKYIAKPRSSHGSLLISEKNINGGDGLAGEKYFFQEFLEGLEFTTCFIGQQFLGQCLTREHGIISRDDKWEASRIKTKKPKIWDHPALAFPKVRQVSEAAWNEMTALSLDETLPYGTVDVRLDERGIPHVIDINPNAYLGLDGNIFSCWSSLGGDFKGLVKKLVGPFDLKDDPSPH